MIQIRCSTTAVLWMRCAVVLALTTMTGRAQPQLLSTPLGAPGETSSFAKGRGEKRARKMDTDLAALAQAERVGLNLFDDRKLVMRTVRQSEDANGRRWLGEIEGAARSSVMLVADAAGRLTGSISVSEEEFYTIRHGDDGRAIVAEADFLNSVVDDAVLEPPAELLQGTKRASFAPAAAQSGAVSVLDMLVVYTPEARAAAGGTSNIVGKINLAISETNQAYVNSGISVQLRLVGAVEGGPSSGQAAAQTYLYQVTTDAAIGGLRNQYGADLVSVWVNGPGAGGGVVGMGWIMQNPSVGFASAAFHVVEVNFANGPYYSFGHEIGHNLGGAHDRANASVAGAYSYSYGMQQPAGGFVTVMAYTGGCSNCRRALYYSNPNVSLSGYPTGVAATATNAADMALTLNTTRTIAEQWRAAVVPASPPISTPAYAPTVTSAAPSAGTGSSPVFTAVFEDRNGAADIRSLLVSIQVGSAQNACLLTIDRPSGTIILRDNANASWISGAELGQPTAISNSQCTIVGAGVTVTANGNSLSLVLPVSFKAGFTGPHDVYLKAEDYAGLNSGWQKVGTWTVPAAVAPVITSVTPRTGTGATAVLTIQGSDANGADDVDTIQILVNARFSGANSCHVAYLPGTNLVYLLNDGATAWTGGWPIGTTATLQNSQCSIALAAAQVVKAGNVVTLTIAVRFATTNSGTKLIYGLVVDREGLRTDWTSYGNWTVGGAMPPVAPVIASLSPAAGYGSTASLVIQASDANSADDVDTVQVLINSRFSGTNSCHLAYLPSTNLVYLLNDGATAWTGGLAVGSNATIQNSQCSVAMSTAQAQKAGNAVTLTLAVRFAAGYSGAKRVYGLVVDREGLRADWTPYGVWTSP